MLVHEECLTGLSAWKAATFPTPLSWGASFNPELVEKMGSLIGESMRTLGIHQGLAPVLDVIRDPRWGRVEECISEDPYAVSVIGTSYVKGVQSQGVHATLKHFVGYSASQSGRNFGPVHAGKREIADVLLPPFEMAIRDGGVRSVMHAYSEIDGVPVAASAEYLTDLLRNQWEFDGVVVADYFGVAFLEKLHQVAENLEDAAGQALEAGVDIELPTGDAYLTPLRQGVEAGRIDESLVDRAVLRALTQKAELGLLDNTFEDEPRARSTWIHQSTGRLPDSSLKKQLFCCPMTAHYLLLRHHRRSRLSDQMPTEFLRCSGATRSSTTFLRCKRDTTLVSTFRQCVRRFRKSSRTRL